MRKLSIALMLLAAGCVGIPRDEIVATAAAWLDFAADQGQAYVDAGKVKQAELDAAVAVLEAALSVWAASGSDSDEVRGIARARVQHAAITLAALFLGPVAVRRDGSIPPPPG